jgi:hypothetical protein
VYRTGTSIAYQVLDGRQYTYRTGDGPTTFYSTVQHVNVNECHIIMSSFVTRPYYCEAPRPTVVWIYLKYLPYRPEMSKTIILLLLSYLKSS